MIIRELIIYDLKVAALIAVFYLFYQLLLARETTHSLNRAVLLSAIALSVVLPLCVVTIHVSAPLALADGGTLADPATLGTPAAETPVATASTSAGTERWGLLLGAILAAGFLTRLFIVGRSCWKLHRLIARGEHHTLPSGTRVSVVEVPVAPFSWMHTVVLPRSEWLSPSPSVLAHEEAHVRHRHSYDVLVVEVLTALQWFNPVVWFLRQELRTLHEYEADASVLSRGFDESQYIHLLMQKATGIQACALANGINTHRTKKRIFMMLKPRSKHSAWLKALYIMPVVLTSLAMTAKTVVDDDATTTDDNRSQTAALPAKNTAYIVNGERSTEEAVGKISQQDIVSVTTIGSKETVRDILHAEADDAVIVETDPVFSICEQLPQFPGGDVKLMEFISRNIRYPKEATEWGVMGRVVVKFIIEKDGSLTNVQAVKMMGLDEPSDTASAVTVNGYATEQERKEANAQNEGLLSARQALIDEAIRVVEAMPKWTPGKQRGKAVRCWYSLPVTYRLN